MMASSTRLGVFECGSVPVVGAEFNRCGRDLNRAEPKSAGPLRALGAYGSIPSGNTISASCSLEYLAVSISLS